jgi:hypothetical protein
MLAIVILSLTCAPSTIILNTTQASSPTIETENAVSAPLAFPAPCIYIDVMTEKTVSRIPA